VVNSITGTSVAVFSAVFIGLSKNVYRDVVVVPFGRVALFLVARVIVRVVVDIAADVFVVGIVHWTPLTIEIRQTTATHRATQCQVRANVRCLTGSTGSAPHRGSVPLRIAA
jgi:hypothetical protein